MLKQVQHDDGGLGDSPNQRLKARAGCDIGQARDFGCVGGAADQHEAAVAIAAIDIAMLVDFQEHARMAERGGNVTRTVAGDAGLGDSKDFGRLDHGGVD